MNILSYCEQSFFEVGIRQCGSSYKKIAENPSSDSRLESSIKINGESQNIVFIADDVAKAHLVIPNDLVEEHLIPYFRLPFKLQLDLERNNEQKLIEMHWLYNPNLKNPIVRSRQFLKIHEEINNIALSCKAFYKAMEKERKFLKLVSIIYEKEKSTFFVPLIEYRQVGRKSKIRIIRPPNYQGEED